jgi:hypothetical protein
MSDISQRRIESRLEKQRQNKTRERERDLLNEESVDVQLKYVRVYDDGRVDWNVNNQGDDPSNFDSSTFTTARNSSNYRLFCYIAPYFHRSIFIPKARNIHKNLIQVMEAERRNVLIHHNNDDIENGNGDGNMNEKDMEKEEKRENDKEKDKQRVTGNENDPSLPFYHRILLSQPTNVSDSSPSLDDRPHILLFSATKTRSIQNKNKMSFTLQNHSTDHIPKDEQDDSLSIQSDSLSKSVLLSPSFSVTPSLSLSTTLTIHHPISKRSLSLPMISDPSLLINYNLRPNDTIEFLLHRHEPPVCLGRFSLSSPPLYPYSSLSADPLISALSLLIGIEVIFIGTFVRQSLLTHPSFSSSSSPSFSSFSPSLSSSPNVSSPLYLSYPNLIVFNKPSGIPVHPNGKYYLNSIQKRVETILGCRLKRK